MRLSLLHAALAAACILTLAGALADPQSGGAGAASPTPAPDPCAAPERRQFDFWIGTWNVVDEKGKPAGVNEIRSILGGCALQENWTGAGGLTGASFNIYDASSKTWHQTWVDSSGSLLLLNGQFRGGRMVLEGKRVGAKGQTVLDRITWERINGDANRVRQLWQSSEDGGKAWTTAFDGTYTRKS
jgi:hypothetical protein